MTVATKAPADTRTRDVRALKALAHPARHRIVELIHERGGEICVCEFADRLDLSQPTISHHLRVLREAGLIDSRQEGTWVYHTIRRETVAALAGRLAAWAERPPEAGAAAACGAGDAEARDSEGARSG
ncbi:MAG TPA: metalloregulator ArsR/SmtB family transcription factor [Gemmatimonadota bacterium]|nr:metalloregulator ArsR/SmtB family transcription factor [Gemmatimonadota bacterium]